jgi:hypothetical protein
MLLNILHGLAFGINTSGTATRYFLLKTEIYMLRPRLILIEEGLG